MFPGGVGLGQAVDHPWLDQVGVGEQVVLAHPHHAHLAAVSRGDAQRVGVDGWHHEVAQRVGQIAEVALDLAQQLPVPHDDVAILDDRGDAERGQVVDQQHVGLVAGRHRTHAAQPEVPRRVDRGHADGQYRVEAVGDGPAHQVIDVALGEDLQRVANSSVQNEKLAWLRSFTAPMSASRLRAALPSRMKTCMPRRTFSRASSGVEHSWSERMKAQR